MKRSLFLLCLFCTLISCTTYQQVILTQEAIIYETDKAESVAVTTIPEGSTVLITKHKPYRKIKYGEYVGWAYSPVYQTAVNYKTDSGNGNRNYKTSTPSTDKTVHVKGYYRKNGTYVSPHTRSAPRRK